ncbi:hypothetical protein [Kaistella palustris]|uniref:hypothetical protein n=1 Tax=Kaistella palustris TaxID=493376 RepID=UPI0003FC5A71|nr:hypothetical protein [Kaistella palustris]
MQFYRKRDFGTFISDTFNFFKEYGRNYFRNYILINGLLLILLVFVFIIGYRELFLQIAGSNTGGGSYYFETYFQENQGVLFLVTGIVFLLFMAVMMVSYLFPVLYIKRLCETGSKNITVDDMLGDLKKNTGRFLKFFLGLVFIVMPLAMIVFGISGLLVFIFVGFLLLILLGPATLSVINFLMYDYFSTDKGFFDSLSYALRAQFSYRNGREKSPFWKYWGSTVVLYLIIQTIISAVTLIPTLIIFGKIFTVTPDGSEPENILQGTDGILFLIFYGIAVLISFLMMNAILVNSGLQYYDSRTDLHRHSDFTEIDSIGTHEI